MKIGGEIMSTFYMLTNPAMLPLIIFALVIVITVIIHKAKASHEDNEEDAAKRNKDK